MNNLNSGAIWGQAYHLLIPIAKIQLELLNGIMDYQDMIPRFYTSCTGPEMYRLEIGVDRVLALDCGSIRELHSIGQYVSLPLVRC
jgi:hypothetical protein